MKVKMQRTKLPRHKHIPFDVDCYVDEVQDILQEVKLTGGWAEWLESRN